MDNQTNGDLDSLGGNLLPLRPDADKGREPDLIPCRMGTRMMSRAALLERIESAFYEEHGDDSPQLREAHTSAQRLRLILDTADYVLAVESITLSQDDKADLIRRAFSDLFGYGPLDELFADERVTTISLDGASRAAVRYGSGELATIPPLFEDDAHLRRILARLLMHAGAELRDDQPIVETGLRVNERPVSISLVGPPVAFIISADMRLHPRQAPSLDDLAQSGFMTDDAAHFLKSLAASPYGAAVVGESETGKTTLLNALANWLPQPERVIAVERAGEMRVPPDTQRLVVQWPVGDMMGISFGDQIGAALVQHPGCILLDEVRADEPESIAPLLEADDAPRQLWAFRGAPDSKRLQSALGMLARRAGTGQGEALVHALYERLPFVISVVRVREQLQLFSIGEWQPSAVSEYPDLVLLFQYQEGAARSTGRNPNRAVVLG
jgi:pilus assembly protein CpaF